MALKTYRPQTPGQRFKTSSSFEEVTTASPEKSLTEHLHRGAGRNNHGRITVRRRGGGHRRRYRVIDFKRDKFGVPGRVETIEYDPNRSARIALIVYADGEKRYILAPQGLAVGRTVMSAETAEIVVGNTVPLSRVPLGTLVHNIELKPGKGGQLARSAGTGAQLMAKEGSYAQLRLPSGEFRRVHLRCLATIGQLGNLDHQNVKLGKAGRARWLGHRPSVRGVAMNPVDHPLGGGEGKSSGGRHPVSPWGWPTKGAKTRKKHKPSDKHIVRRRRKRK